MKKTNKKIIKFIKQNFFEEIKRFLSCETLGLVIDSKEAIFCTEEFLEWIFNECESKNIFKDFSEFLVMLKSEKIIDIDYNDVNDLDDQYYVDIDSRYPYKVICITIDELKLLQICKMGEIYS